MILKEDYKKVLQERGRKFGTETGLCQDNDSWTHNESYGGHTHISLLENGDIFFDYEQALSYDVDDRKVTYTEGRETFKTIEEFFDYVKCLCIFI